MSENNDTTFQRLLADAVNKPGSIMKAYSVFHNYSFGNQLLAYFQCAGRGIEIGPINTYNGWKALGRQVQKGQKALVLCMPVTMKGKKEIDTVTGEEKQRTFARFVYRPNWFALAQTEGDAFEMPSLPDFDMVAALANLKIKQVPFASTSGNTQGYAKDRTIAINPVAQLPLKTMMHELAHVVLGHTTKGEAVDSEKTPKNIREVEAEAVAMICCEALGLEGAEYCRGYIQSYLKDETISEKSARAIMSCATKILKAGYPASGKMTEPSEL